MPISYWLVKRSIPGAVIYDPDLIAQRVVKMIDQQKVETIDGKTINLHTDTICLHGDNKNALNIINTLSTEDLPINLLF